MRMRRRMWTAVVACLGTAAYLVVGIAIPPSGAAFSSTASRAGTFTGSTAFTYASGVRYDNPHFHLRLADAAGAASLADASGNNRPGTNPVTDSGTAASRYQVAGAPVGDSDTGARFDGTGAYVVRNAAETSPTADYSIEVWFRTSSASGGIVVASICPPPNPTCWTRMMYVDSGGRLTYGDYTGGGTPVQTVRSGGRVDNGAWHHAVGVHAGSNLTLYLNGTLQATVASPPYVEGAYWVVGGANVGWDHWTNPPTSKFLNGDIDEFAYYEYGLTGTKVTNHRNAIGNGTGYATAVKADNPELYWRLNEPALSVTAADASTKGASGHYYLTDRIVGAQPGALTTVANDATWFSGRYTNAYQPVAFTNPQDFTIQLWFRSTTRRGGVLVGFATQSTGVSTGYDRHVYMLNDGRLAFGAWTGSASVAYSTGSYHDGQWHMVAASIGPAGIRLHVDGALVGQHAATTAENYTGYWRLGGSPAAGWPDAPLADYFTGHLDEFAVIPTQLPDARIAQLYGAR